MAETYAVVLVDPNENTGQEQVKKIGKALENALDIIAYDAICLARDATGILVENVSLKQAQNTVSALKEYGIEAGWADAALLGSKPEQKKVKEIAVRKENLRLQTGYTGFEEITWDRVTLLNICFHQILSVRSVKVKKKRKRLNFGSFAAGIVGGPVGSIMYNVCRKKISNKKQVKKQLNTDELYIADIQVTNPSVIYRLFSNECRYTYLGERLKKRAEFNFQTVIQDVAQTSTQVLIAPPALRFLEGDSLEGDVICNLADFENYNRWLFLAAAAFNEKNKDTVTTRKQNPKVKKSVQDDFSF